MSIKSQASVIRVKITFSKMENSVSNQVHVCDEDDNRSIRCPKCKGEIWDISPVCDCTTPLTPEEARAYRLKVNTRVRKQNERVTGYYLSLLRMQNVHESLRVHNVQPASFRRRRATRACRLVGGA